jgi:hypothetical protein
VIVFVVPGDNNPLGSGELLFQVMSVSLLLLPSEGGGTLTCMGLVRGLACSSHDSEESLLLSLRDNHDALSHCCSVLLLPLSAGGDLLLHDQEVGGAACIGRQDNGGRRRTLGLGQR